jgi:hypothetical protein
MLLIIASPTPLLHFGADFQRAHHNTTAEIAFCEMGRTIAYLGGVSSVLPSESNQVFLLAGPLGILQNVVV